MDPEIDLGRFPIKRIAGDRVEVRAAVFAEGHEGLSAVLRYRRRDESTFSETPMRPLGNDRWSGAFPVPTTGSYEYTIEAWIDRFASFREGLEKKVAAGLGVESELLEGAALVQAAAERASGEDARWLRTRARAIAAGSSQDERVAQALDAALCDAMARHPDRSEAAAYPRTLGVTVERERAAVGAWYEFFPRSAADDGRHARFKDAVARLRHAASMGFDVVYLPPIHPIGTTHRKGPNNTPTAAPGDPGSPWAIGSSAGGHTAVHPELGTLADFEAFVAEAAGLGLEIALDIAFQCSPDHPWVTEHPEWFRHRPDGSIHYAENPPKKYQDIYPLDFESADWRALWAALRDVFLFWAERGVRIFRVDNPHTKPFAFWEWVIAEVRERHPDAVFLSEAFTRPAPMQRLAKVGFSQSYNYFTWRNTKQELTGYLEELNASPVREFLRPNFFANTPDINPEFLQMSGRAGFQIRLVLAATLAGSYGIYGPVYELCIADALAGREEYLDSEKFEIRAFDLDRSGNIVDFIRRVNEIRNQHRALRRGRLRFLDVDCDDLIAYARVDATQPDETLIVVVALSPHHAASGTLELPLEELGIDADQPYQMHDLLGGARFLWHGRRNFVALDPRSVPAHVFRVRSRLRSERDFDYFL